MEEALYRAHAAHERAALGLKHSEANLNMRRDAIIAALSAELLDAREELRLHRLAAAVTPRSSPPAPAAAPGGRSSACAYKTLHELFLIPPFRR